MTSQEAYSIGLRLLGWICSVEERIGRYNKKMAQFDDDIAALTATEAADETAIAQVATLVQTDGTTIAALQAEVATLKSSGAPSSALAPLESLISKLNANNATLASLVPAPTAPTAPVPPTS